MKPVIQLSSFIVLAMLFPAADLSAQVLIQLPVIRVFNVQTVVSVPDGGTISLGGVNRTASGSVGRGVPGLAGPGFKNRGFGRSAGASRASATATVISLKEMEAQLLADAKRQREKLGYKDPNGSAAMQKQADYLSRHIGRSRKKR